MREIRSLYNIDVIHTQPSSSLKMDATRSKHAFILKLCKTSSLLHKATSHWTFKDLNTSISFRSLCKP